MVAGLFVVEEVDKKLEASMMMQAQEQVEEVNRQSKKSKKGTKSKAVNIQSKRKLRKSSIKRRPEPEVEDEGSFKFFFKDGKMVLRKQAMVTKENTNESREITVEFVLNRQYLKGS